MNDKTEQTVADEPRGTAAGGHAVIINVPGCPLMVRAVDYNTLRAQLAAAVAAEREKCAGIVNELRMECARRNMPESATMLWHAEDAIRAGAKEPSDG